MTCACGCGRTPKKKDSRYLRGHHQRSSGVDYIVNSTGCWEWQLSIRKGYGRACVNGRSVAAHRLYYERTNGPIPPGMELDHLCRNRRCVNPDHLEAVTTAENLRRGESTKLTRANVDLIRARTMTGREAAERFGITVDYVYQLRNRPTTWKD